MEVTGVWRTEEMGQRHPGRRPGKGDGSGACWPTCKHGCGSMGVSLKAAFTLPDGNRQIIRDDVEDLTLKLSAAAKSILFVGQQEQALGEVVSFIQKDSNRVLENKRRHLRS